MKACMPAEGLPACALMTLMHQRVQRLVWMRILDYHLCVFA